MLKAEAETPVRRQHNLDLWVRLKQLLQYLGILE